MMCFVRRKDQEPLDSMRKDSTLGEDCKIGDVKATVLSRDYQGKYTSKNGSSHSDPVKVGKTVLVKRVNTTIQVETIQESDVQMSGNLPFYSSKDSSRQTRGKPKVNLELGSQQ